MAFDIARFNGAFTQARYEQESDPNFDLAAARQSLLELIADVPAGEDRDFALGMIDDLAEPPPQPRAPSEWSPLYREAAAIHAAAYPTEGTDEEKADALAQARHKIWAIADRASPEEAPHIRAMTRALDHIEGMLRQDWPKD